MNYKTRESTTEHIVDHISEDVILENAYDNHHGLSTITEDGKVAGTL